jgi:hypothetical protein
MKIFVDIDGVLADFDRHYIETIELLPDRSDPARDVNWSKIGDMDFFASIPPMADAFELHGPNIANIFKGLSKASSKKNTLSV